MQASPYVLSQKDKKLIFYPSIPTPFCPAGPGPSFAKEAIGTDTGTPDQDRSLYQGQGNRGKRYKESKVKKFFVIALMALALVLLPVAIKADTTASKSVTIAATYEGGVSLSIDKAALTWPAMHFPHDLAWVTPTEGAISVVANWAVVAGHHVKLSLASAAWTPVMNTFGPESTLQVVCPGFAGIVVPAPAVGGESIIDSSVVTSGTCVGTWTKAFTVQLKNVNAQPGNYSTSLTFIWADVL
jgi:hypothetical protein